MLELLEGIFGLLGLVVEIAMEMGTRDRRKGSAVRMTERGVVR
jgi:hypothetical protein